MTSSWRSALGAAAALVLAGPARAQMVRELGPQGLVVVTEDETFVGAGGFLAVRPSARTRIALTAAAGVQRSEASGRFELLAHLLATPFARRGAGVYGGAGVALTTGPLDRGYLTLVLGLEGKPGGRSGWVVEVGIGGGARIGVGWRWRTPPAFPPSRP